MSSSSSAAASKPTVSFTIRRPTPASRTTSSGADSDSSSFKIPALPRHLARDASSAPGSPLAAASPKRHYADDSSDEEDDEPQDELVTGFDEFGVQRLQEKKKPQGPLVIAPLQNRDWRELARRRRNGLSYVPPGGAAGTGADGSVGGLGTRDSINSGPQVEGLQVRTKRVKIEADAETEQVAVKEEAEEVKKELTEDELAMRALLAGGTEEGGPIIDVIPSAANEARRLPTEDDAFKQDVDELPDVATLEDYERVPVSQFGAALLRGMGWKEGQAASRKGKGPVEPWLPQARPALLGIGAKEKEVLDDGSAKKGRPARPERRYVPVIKKEREGSESRSRRNSRSPERSVRSRRSSRSRSPARESRRDREREAERERDGGRRDRYARDVDAKRERRTDGKQEYRERERRRERDRY